MSPQQPDEACLASRKESEGQIWENTNALSGEKVWPVIGAKLLPAPGTGARAMFAPGASYD